MRSLWIAGILGASLMSGAYAENPPSGSKGGNKPGAGRPGVSRPGAGRPGNGAAAGPRGGANPLMRVFTVADANQDGKVSLDELKAATERLNTNGPLRQNLDKLFQRLDANGDGALTKEEMQSVGNRRPGNKPADAGAPRKRPESKGKNKPDKP